ncbi:phosphotransferase family protein [Occultella gossypii]|uniref:Aminoglycoside phosphotransferase family protein n=1 Tax=Occultella gossypii TaxID=2800820 RepID=A0ABS7SAR1_9MICO|nr:aminoglycoside phosphotransferase family protein [Occultella gossypii]MBZ2197430.1 aminoglycoside phosphotransferase family protein [Occultella gossypii]
MDLTAVLPTDLRVTAVVPRGGGSGRMSTVYEVRRAVGEPLIAKRYADQWLWKQAKEVHVYSLLANVPGTPSVVHVDAENAMTVLTMVPGEPLSAAPVTGDEAWRDVYRQIGELTRAVHEIAMPGFGYLTTELVDPAPDNAAYMTALFTRHLAQFADLGGTPATHRRAVEWVADRARLLGLCEAPTLCHNDLHEGNVMVERAGSGWRVTGLVDVENAIAADPLMDLAKTVQYELTRSPVKVAGLLAGYGSLPASGLARIELYRLCHALELWNWFAQNGDTGPLASIAQDIHDLVTTD